jgi:hypothetical protein
MSAGATRLTTALVTAGTAGENPIPAMAIGATITA